MAYRDITQGVYDRLLESYRERPGNVARAARHAGCAEPTAKRGWERGWAPRVTWARAIKTVLREEQESARAAQRRAEDALRAAAQSEREAARADAVKALAQEGQMLAAGRVNVLSILASATQMLPSLRKITEEANRQLADAKTPLDPKLALRLVRDFGLTCRHLVEASNRLIEAERRHKGEPSTVVGIEHSGSLTLEEAAREIEEASALWALAKERGLVSDPVPTDLGAEVGSPGGRNGSNGAGVH